MDTAEYFKLSRHLEQYHAVFYKLWEMGEPIWTESVPTAGVSFNPVRYYFNPTFYNNLNLYNRAFVIAHESMHILLNHGVRIPNGIHKIKNIAMDIALHEIMFNKMGFERDLVSLENIATRDFVCPKADPNESAEYYYDYLIDNNVEMIDVQMVDDHSKHNGDNQSIVDKLENSLSPEDLESFNKIEAEENNRGSNKGVQSKIFKIRVPKKRKWESLIREHHKRSSELDPEYQWAMSDRRRHLLDKNLLLPSVYKNKYKKDRQTVFFYQDSSGSCSGLAERFFTAAKSIPEDRFDVRLFCFDTEVYNVDKDKGELFGFGGTSFDIIEEHVQRTISKEKLPYPTVWIVTDGYGNQVIPKYPKKWFWLLTEFHSKNCIPKESHMYQLKEFE